MSEDFSVTLNIDEISQILADHITRTHGECESLGFDWHFPVFGDVKNFSVTISKK